MSRHLRRNILLTCAITYETTHYVDQMLSDAGAQALHVDTSLSSIAHMYVSIFEVSWIVKNP